MSNTIYIAQNNQTSFNIDIPAFDTTGVETATFQPQNLNKNVEAEYVVNKSLVSLGFIIISVFFILCFVIFFKKKRESGLIQPQTIEKQYMNVSRQVQKSDSASNEENTQRSISTRKKATLYTPSSINKCIRAFLENTKEN